MRFALGFVTYAAVMLAPALFAHPEHGHHGHHGHGHHGHGHHGHGHHGHGHHDVAAPQQLQGGVFSQVSAAVSPFHYHEAARLAHRLAEEARMEIRAHEHLCRLLERISIEAHQLARVLESHRERNHVRDFARQLDRTMDELRDVSRRHRGHDDAFRGIEHTYRELEAALRHH